MDERALKILIAARVRLIVVWWYTSAEVPTNLFGYIKDYLSIID